MVQIIEVGSEAYNMLIQEIVSTTIKVCKAQMEVDDELLTQEEAMKLMKVDSTQRMAQIRESGIIKSKKLGKEYRYSKKNILQWINR